VWLTNLAQLITNNPSKPGYELLSHPPDLVPSDFILFADLNKMLAGKKFFTNQEVIAEIEANF
jgi:hypothetical protein